MRKRSSTLRTSVAYVSVVLAISLFVTACQQVYPVASAGEPSGDDRDQSLIIYSGRSENLVAPLIDTFAASTGIDVEVRYGDTAEMAATIMEEGVNSPADVFFGQDAGALGALADAGRLAVLPDSVLEPVEARFKSADGTWVGISGRARVLVYNTEQVPSDNLPASIWGLTDENWRGRVGWAPTNGSFQAFVTALRVLEGEARAKEWLEAMVANDVQSYPNNSSIVAAVGAGEISVGLVNHYYLYRFLAEEGPDFGARNHFFPEANAGSMINVAGAGLVDTATNVDAALTFIEYLLSDEAQQYFADETVEYPLVTESTSTPEDLVPLANIATPDIDLGTLDDLQGTLELLQEIGALN